MCMMMADTMDALGLAGKYVVKVNNRKVLDGVLESIGLGAADPAKSLVVLRAIDKADRLGASGVRDLLGKGRKDDSGDFTAGAGLNDDAIDKILTVFVHAPTLLKQISPRDTESVPPEMVSEFNSTSGTWFASYDNAETIRSIKSNAKVDVDLFNQGVAELEQIAALTAASGYPAHKIKIDPTVVRGLEYYTGPVFEIELTFKVQNEKGQDVVFGSVGGGGRYDGLVSRFRSEPVPATGFSIGVSRLANALKLTGNLGATEPTGPVVVLVMDKAETARYQAITSALRKAGIRAEMFMGNTKNFGKQVAYADKRNAPAVIIEGSQEREQGIVQIKDLIVGKEAAAAITDNAEYKAARPGQFECPGDLASIVAAISELPAVANYLKDNQ